MKTKNDKCLVSDAAVPSKVAQRWSWNSQQVDKNKTKEVLGFLKYLTASGYGELDELINFFSP